MSWVKVGVTAVGVVGDWLGNEKDNDNSNEQSYAAAKNAAAATHVNAQNQAEFNWTQGLNNAVTQHVASANQIQQQYTGDYNRATGQFTSDLNQAHALDIGSRNQFEAMNVGTQNEYQRWLAENKNARSMTDYQSDVNMDQSRTDASFNLFDRKYGIANMQSGYDKFQEEFGDMQDNVYDTINSLSEHSRKAQINDQYQENLVYEMEGLQQHFNEMGISPSSGMFQASRMQLRNQNASERIKAGRNVDLEIAGAKTEYMGQRANDPYFNRANDLEAGVATQDQLNSMISDGQRGDRTNLRASATDLSEYNPIMGQSTDSRGGMVDNTGNLMNGIGSLFSAEDRQHKTTEIFDGSSRVVKA